MAAASSRGSGFETRSQNAAAFLTSFVFHLAMLLILACWALTAGKNSHGLLLSADMGESDSVSVDMVQTFDLTPQVEQSLEESQSPEVTVDLDLLPDLDQPKQEAGAFQPVGGIEQATVESVVKNLNMEGNGRGANFFGTYASGNRFIYVLDSSTSMLGERWIYACHQLLDSLNGLEDGQEFLVICFDTQTRLMFGLDAEGARYYAPTKENIGRVGEWLSNIRLRGGTMPLEALTLALDLQPDAVFLLSDGELWTSRRNRTPSGVFTSLRRMNGKSSVKPQTPIHTVHLFSTSGLLTLKNIAAENRGTFTPVKEQRIFGSLRVR